MRVVFDNGLCVFHPETDAERADVARWDRAYAGHVFALGKGCAFHDFGLREVACREPINILFKGADPRWALISNLARTPFTLHGQSYASVEGFWQSLRYASDTERADVAGLWGAEAKRAARDAERFVYRERTYIVGGHEHWGLMREACDAKFEQRSDARDALLATGDRPLVHRVRKDSRTIPGVVMADIWMRVRADLARVLPEDQPSGDQAS